MRSLGNKMEVENLYNSEVTLLSSNGSYEFIMPKCIHQPLGYPKFTLNRTTPNRLKLT
jgi:hypothetical protein